MLFSYPRDRSKSSMMFIRNITPNEVIEQVRTLTSTDHLGQVLKQLRKEILSSEVIPNEFLCDEFLIEQLLKKSHLPDTWQIFMQALFSAMNKKLSENYNRRALSVFHVTYFMITQKQTPNYIALAQSIYHLTQTKHLINILNKLEHCICYKALKNLDKKVTTSIV